MIKRPGKGRCVKRNNTYFSACSVCVKSGALCVGALFALVVVPKTFLSEILTAAHACGCSLLAPQCCLPTMSEDEARRLVEKMSIHNQRWLMVAEGTFTVPYAQGRRKTQRASASARDPFRRSPCGPGLQTCGAGNEEAFGARREKLTKGRRLFPVDMFITIISLSRVRVVGILG